MYLTPEKKAEIFATYGQGPTDTGSPESQIALFSVPSLFPPEQSKANH